MNNNTISLISLAASLLFTGAYLSNAISGRRELKEQLREIKMEQQRTMRLVDSINTDYARKRSEYLAQTQAIYRQLDTIIDLKMVNSKRLGAIQGQVQNQLIRLDENLSELKEINNSEGIRQ